MGVHTTFVRSVDLDEWTQRQIDAMRLGGNANARQFFRQHGLTDMHGKIEKKYTSKAAVAYKAELAKQMDAAAAQRGETTTTTTGEVAGNLLENLALQDKQEKAATAASAVSAVAKPKAQLASQMAGAKGKLVVTPPNSGGLSRGGLAMLRKPGNKTSSAMMLKKKPSGGASTKLRVNKLTVGDGFDDIGAVQNTTTEEEAEPEKAEEQMNGNAPVPVPVVAPPSPAPVAPPKEPEKSKSTMETGVAKLKMMNNDFFSGV